VLLKRSDDHHSFTAATSAPKSRRLGGIRGMLPAIGTEEARREKTVSVLRFIVRLEA